MVNLYQEYGVTPSPKKDKAPPKKDLYTEYGVTPSPKKVAPSPGTMPTDNYDFRPNAPWRTSGETKMDKAGDFFTGNLRDTRATRELPEAMEAGIGEILGNVPTSKGLAVTAALTTAFDDEEFYKILEANAAGPISRQWDEKGNMIIAYGPDQKKVVLNRPGFSGQDALQMVGTGVLYNPAGSIQGEGLRGMGKVGLGAALTETGIQAGQSAAGGSFDKMPIGFAGLGGAAFKWIANKLAATFPNAMGVSAKSPTVETKQFVRDELLKIGFDASQITDDMVGNILQQAKGATNPRTIPAVAGETEFGIDLTKGGRTLDQSQLSFEDSARVGMFGDKARGVMSDFDTKVEGQINTAVEAQRARLGGVPADKATSGRVIAEGVKDAEAAAYQVVDDAYAEVGSATLDTDGLHKLLNATRKAVMGIDKDRGLPQTSSLLSSIAKTQKQMVAVEKAGVTLRPTDFKQLELLRRRINTAVGEAEKSDYGQVSAMRRAYDDWLDQAIVNDLFKGDAGTIANMKTARGIFAEYAGLFRRSPAIGRAGIKVPDREGAFIERIVAADPTGEEVVNAIFGAQGLSKVSGAKMATRIRSILGPESDGWKAVRQEAFRRLLVTNSVNGRDMVSGQKSLSALNKAMTDNSTLMKAVFSTDEIGTMRRLFAQIQRTNPEILRSRENPSGSGQKIFNAFRGLFNTLGMSDATFFIAGRGMELSSGMTKASKAASAVRPFSQTTTPRPEIISGGEALQREIVE